MTQDYELKAKPGTTLSQRKLEFTSVRFVAVRNLAHIHYKKPDGTQLLSYSDTLQDRNQVMRVVLEYEVAMGYIVDDGSGFDTTNIAAQPNNQNGTTMTQPKAQFTPPAFTPPPATAPVAPAPAAFQPAVFPPVPQPQVFSPPAQPMAPVPVAAPVAEQPAAETPKVSRRRANGAGSSVAAPPAAPPASAPVQAFPAAAPFPAASSFAPAPFAAPVQQPVQAPVAQAPAVSAAPVPSVDLTPLITAINELGAGVSIAANNGNQALKAVADLAEAVKAVQGDLNKVLAAQQHLYLSNPQLQAMTEGKANDLPNFKTYLSRYTGP